MLKWFEDYIKKVTLETYIRHVNPGLRAEVGKLVSKTIHECMETQSEPMIRVQLDDGAYMPERAHSTDAGADIRCISGFIVPAHDSVEVGTGVHVELPRWTKAELVSKSGLNVKHCIQTEGLIDAGYSGEIRVRVYNHGDYDYMFEAGDKLTQLVITDVLLPTFHQVESIDGGERGDSGFGSTGRG